MKNSGIALALCAFVGLVGCEEKKPAPVPTSVPKPSMPAPSAPAPRPAPAPSAAPAPPPSGAASDASSVAVAGFTFPLPSGWKSVPPSNQMRLAEIQVPDASGDAAKACVIAFSSAGGDVQSNLDRWAGQVKDASGQPAKPLVEKKTVAGVPVTIAELAGSYSGMGEPAPHENWMLRGAIIESPGGLLFVKMTGPAEQMKAAGAGFVSMIDGLKKQ